MIRQLSPTYIITALILVFLVWAALFELDESVCAKGTLVPRGRVQVVQVTDGGVLAELLVNEGDVVAEGQIIARLEDTRATARRDESDAERAALSVARARAIAEAQAVTPDFSAFPAAWNGIISSQKEYYQQRQDRHLANIGALQAALEATQTEYDIVLKLSQGGDVSNLRVLQVGKDLADKRQALQDADYKFREEALKEVSQIDQDLFSLQYQLTERENIVAKTNILAPKAGIVSALNVATIGASMAPGQEFATIAPTQEALYLEAKVMPVDVGRLRTGLPVSVQLDAFDGAIYGKFDGVLTLIGADAATEETSAGPQNYFRAQVDMDWASNVRIDPALLRSGMVGQVDIKTGKRTVLAYLLKPLLRGFGDAMTGR